MTTNKPRAQGKTSTGRAETYLHRKFQTYKKNPTFPIYEKMINLLATVYKEPVSVVERDLPNQALTKEQYAIYKSIVAHGFLPFEALILASGDRSITQINTPVWQRSLKDRRREIRKLKAQGLNAQQIRAKIINFYLKNPKCSPWNFIRIECGPEEFDLEHKAHETLAFKEVYITHTQLASLLDIIHSVSDIAQTAYWSDKIEPEKCEVAHCIGDRSKCEHWEFCEQTFILQDKINNLNAILPKRKCDSCGEPAINFSSPLGNSDEPALCDECFKKMNEQMHEKAGGNR